MVGTIAPLVQAAKKTWGISIRLFLLASTGAAGAFGATLGLAGIPVASAFDESDITRILITLAGFCALIDLHILPLMIPTTRRSVPQQWWTRFGPFRASIAYGAVLGLGVTTFVPLAGFYFVLTAALLLGPASGGLIVACYGFGRALPVLAASAAIAAGGSPVVVGRWMMANNRRMLMRRLTSVALLVVGVGLLLISAVA